MLEAALALCRSFSSSEHVGGGALSGPSREGSECCGKSKQNALWKRECLKGREGQ